jgi:hypothetical protein
MDNFFLTDYDVVSLDSDGSFTKSPTATSKELLIALGDRLSSNTELNTTAMMDWVSDGVACKILQAEEGGGWQTGKVRLRIEFLPD